MLTTLECEPQSLDPRIEFQIFDTLKSIIGVSEFFNANKLDPVGGSKVYRLQIILKEKLDFLRQREHLVTAICQVSKATKHCTIKICILLDSVVKLLKRAE